MTLTLSEGAITVTDVATEFFKIDSQMVEIDVDNTKRTTYKWTLKNVRDASGQRVSMAYRLTIQKTGFAALLTATPIGYSNTFQATGLCSGV